MVRFKQFMEPSEPLFNHLNKINNLMNKIIWKNITYVIDKLVDILSNVLDFFDQFFKSLIKELHIHNTSGSQQYLLNVPKTNTQVFVSNSININLINYWNKMIHKIHLIPWIFLLHYLNTPKLLNIAVPLHQLHKRILP